MMPDNTNWNWRSCIWHEYFAPLIGNLFSCVFFKFNSIYSSIFSLIDINSMRSIPMFACSPDIRRNSHAQLPTIIQACIKAFKAAAKNKKIWKLQRFRCQCGTSSSCLFQFRQTRRNDRLIANKANALLAPPSALNSRNRFASQFKFKFLFKVGKIYRLSRQSNRKSDGKCEFIAQHGQIPVARQHRSSRKQTQVTKPNDKYGIIVQTLTY